MPECTLRQPAGARAVAEGHEERQDDHKNNQGHRAARGERNGKQEANKPQSWRIQKKRRGFCFYKRKIFLRVSFFLIKTFIKMGKITSSSHDCFNLLQPPNPLTCSSWEAFPQYPHIVVLKKIKVRWNRNVLLQANTRLQVCDWMDKARNG